MPLKHLTEKETYDTLSRMEKQKDYAGMAKLVCDSYVLEGNLEDSSQQTMNAGFTRFFKDFARRNRGKVTDRKKETLLGVLSEIQRIRVDSILHAAGEIEKWEKDIVEGKVDELIGLKEDKKNAHRLAHDIVMQKDPKGVYVGAGINAFGSIIHEVSSNSPMFDEVLKRDYKKKTLSEFDEVTERTDSKLITKYITENGSMPLDKAKKVMAEYESGAPKASEYGFKINRTIGFEDGKLCSVMPEKYKAVEGLKSADEFEGLISEHEANILAAEKINKAAQHISKDGRALVWELDDKVFGNEISNNEKFIRMQEIVENLSNLGTSYKIPFGKKKMATKDISPNHISKDLKELNKLCRDILPEIDDLSESEMQAASEAVKMVKDFADKHSRAFKQVTTGNEKGTTGGMLKSSLEAIDFIETQGKFRNIDLSEGHIKRTETNRMRKSANAIDDVITEAESAKEGVYRGSKKYDDAVDSLYSLSNAYNIYRDVFSSDNSTIEEKDDALEQLRIAGGITRKAIDKYFERKTEQGKMDGNADEKSQKRIDALKKASTLTDGILGEVEKSLAPEASERLSAKLDEISETAEPEEDIDEIEDAIEATVMDRETRHSNNAHERMINNAAENAARLLAEYAKDNDPKPLTPAEQLTVRKAMLAMAYQDYFTKTDKGSKAFEGLVEKNVSPMDYDRRFLNKKAMSQEVVRSMGEITHETIVSFMTDKKAPLKLIDKLSAERVRESEQAANVTRGSTANKELKTAKQLGSN